MSTTPITILPGTLPEGYCWPDSPQQYNFDIISLVRASLNQNFPGVYKGATDDPPPSDQRDRIWVNTDNNLIYLYINGKWRRKYQFEHSSSLLLMWTDSIANLATFGGGAVGAGENGPLWEVVAEFAGRVPIGVGDIPTSDPLATISAPGLIKDSLDSSGEYKHTLTEQEGSGGQHVHPFGVSNPSSDDAFFRKVGTSTVPGYTGYYITGSADNNTTPQTTADLVTSPSGLDGAGVTAVGHKNMQPWRSVYFIRRTSRIFVEPPN